MSGTQQNASEQFNRTISSVYFIGIGGVGMSGIALVAARQGLKVSGSDLKESKYSRQLRAQGIQVFIGHDQNNISQTSPDVVVVSSAIPQNNPELKYAIEMGIEIWPRAKMLAYVCLGSKVIAVAGTHGKTTTSSMLASALVELKADPSFLVGGIIESFNSNARYGVGEWCAIEADESDGSFIYLNPYIAIVTNIEADHLDHYADINEINDSFVDFLRRLDDEGAAIVYGDQEGLSDLVKSATEAKIITYGLDESNDYVVKPSEDGSFVLTTPNEQKLELKISSNPGVHNMLNGSAVVIALVEAGFDVVQAAKAVQSFKGVRRRFDLIGQADGITVIDDYGHHPTEIAATLSAASTMGYSRICVLFQPHRYSRTQALVSEFATAFDKADKVMVMDVYSAGEAPIPGVTGKTVVDSVLKHDPDKDICWIEGRHGIPQKVASEIQPGDLFITMGAGDVTAIAPLVLEELSNRQ